MLEEMGAIQSRMADIQSRLDALSPAKPNPAAFADALQQAQEEGSEGPPAPIMGGSEGIENASSISPPKLGPSNASVWSGEQGPGGPSGASGVYVTPAALGPLPHLPQTGTTPLPVTPESVLPLQAGQASDVNALAETYAAKYGLPSSLVKAVIKTESGGNPRAVSRAGAMGLMQLMPANVQEAGISNPFDPEQNIAAGTAQLSSLMKQYDGDLDLTLAGYNAGPGNVKKWGGVPPFRETRDYIRKVRGLMESNP